MLALKKKKNETEGKKKVAVKEGSRPLLQRPAERVCDVEVGCD